MTNSDIVVVTGAASGIGRAVSEHLLERRHGVVAVDRDSQALAALVEQWRGAGSTVRYRAGDVADRTTHEAALAEADEIDGRLAAWVNCAGVTATQPLHDTDEGFVAGIIETNQLGTLWGCVTAVRRFLQEASPGAIVNISSIHGRLSSRGHAVYEMTKGAVEALTRSIAVGYGPSGIRANAIAPGAIVTPALERSLAAAQDPAATRARLAAETPLQRLGHAYEVARAVAFLLSADSSYINGQTLRVDGGWSSALSTAGIGLEPTAGDGAAPREHRRP